MNTIKMDGLWWPEHGIMAKCGQCGKRMLGPNQAPEVMNCLGTIPMEFRPSLATVCGKEKICSECMADTRHPDGTSRRSESHRRCGIDPFESGSSDDNKTRAMEDGIND